MKKFIVPLLTAVMVVSMIFTGCVPGAAPPVEPVTPPVEPVTPPVEPVTPPEAPEVVIAKIGFNAALTGPVAGWGLPGLYGCEIWVDHFNAEGGITLSDGTQVLAELVPYDNEYTADKALAGARKLVLEDEVVMVQHLGGGPAMACLPFYNEHKMLTTNISAGDMSPESPYHICPLEIWDLYGVAAYAWLAETRPELETVALAAPSDLFGHQFMAASEAGAKAAGIEVVYSKFYDPEAIDFTPVMSDLIAADADFIAFYAYPGVATLMMVAAYDMGYEGLIHQVVFDFLPNLIERTSLEFMEGHIALYPDFDDPALNPSLNPYAVLEPIDLWNEYQAKYPGVWTAVSWEYTVGLDTWKQGVIAADSIEPMKVLEALKAMPTLYTPFGEVQWWGEPLWGIDNGLVGKWPIVEVKEDGSQRVAAWVDLIDWWERNEDIMIAANEEHGIMWYQIMGLTREQAIAQYPEAFK